MVNKMDKPQKDTRAYLENKMRGGRYSLMLVLIFTVVNVAFLLLDFNSYFLFSASLPYYLTAFGKGFDNAFTNGSWDVTGTYTLIALGISVVILGIFLLCWLLSKKRYGWLVAALVLFLLDTLFLAGFTWLLMDNPMENLVDFLFHLWVVWELFQAVRAGRKLSMLPEDLDGVPGVYRGGPEL